MADFYGKEKGKLWSDYKDPSEKGEEKSLMQSDPTAYGAQYPNQGYGMPMMTPPQQNQGYGMPMMPPQQFMPGPAVPYVQPIIMLPFAAPVQPLFADDDFDEAGEFDSPSEYGEMQTDAKPTKRRVNVGSILVFVFGILTLAVMALGYFVDTLTFLNVTENGSAVGAVLAFFNKEDGASLLLAIGLAVAAVFALLTALVGLFTIKRRFPIVGKIFGILSLVGGILAVVAGFTDENITLAIGAYVIVALTALTAISALAARRRA